MSKKAPKVSEQVDSLLAKLQPGLRTKKKAALADFGASFLKRSEWCSKEEALRLFLGEKKFPVGLLAICGKKKSAGAFQKAAYDAIDLVWSLLDPAKNTLDWFIFRQVFLRLDQEQVASMCLASHEQRPSVASLLQLIASTKASLEEADRVERESPQPIVVEIAEPSRRTTFSFLRPPRHSKGGPDDEDEKSGTKLRSSTLTTDNLPTPSRDRSPSARERASSRTPPSPVRVMDLVKHTSTLPALLDSIMKEDVQSSTQALAGLEGPIDTVFDPQRVRAYRVGKGDFTKEFHEGVADWHVPEFFSDRSLPENFVLQCSIYIDAAFSFSVLVTEQSLVSSLLEKAVVKAKMKGLEYPHPMLKVRGCCSYLNPAKPCISYFSAREAARAGRNLELILVNKPESPAVPVSPWRLGWGGAMYNEPASSHKLLSQQTGLFKVKELSVTGLRETNASVFARVLVTYGAMVLTTSASALLPFQKRLKFNLVAPDPAISFSQFPKEARLGVSFHADQQGKRSLLGWSVMQMFDEKGVLRQGTCVLKLRDPPEALQSTKLEEIPELCQLFARASTAEGKQETGTTLQLEEFGNPIYHDDAVAPHTQLGGSRTRGDSSTIRSSVTPKLNDSKEGKSSPPPPPPHPSTICQCPPSEDKNKFCIKCGKKRAAVVKEKVVLKPGEIQCTCGKVVERTRVYCFGCGSHVSKLLALESRRVGGATSAAGTSAANGTSHGTTSAAATAAAAPSSATASTTATSASSVHAPPPSHAPPPPPPSNSSANKDSRRPPSEDLSVWAIRTTLTDKPHMLVPVLLSCNWSSPSQRAEARRLLSVWARPLLVHALQLLDVTFADPAVRELAVSSLASLPACRLQLYLLQLTQCLKFEFSHCSSLSTFLVKSALKHPLVIGHPLYYHLRTEMQTHPSFAERYSLILMDFLSYGGPLVRELRVQVEALGQMQKIAEMVVARKEAGKMSKEEIMQEYNQELVKLNCYFLGRLNKMKLPLNPQVEVTALIVEKCRFMSSKKVPLWLTFVNVDPSVGPVDVIFKSGDDLRQDMLTLQLLSIMDDFWLQDGHDLRLTPYRVLATGVNSKGEGMGMIEVVTNADTTSGIQGSFGGGAMGAFKLTPLHDYLTQHNNGDLFKAAVNIFMRSSAGYCVATYVMGIGDRHNGNIMVKNDGHLFHIDFGHFLGNFKSKFGVRRERAPFVFTPEMAFVIGGKNFEQAPLYKTFEELCVKAFNALRSREALLYVLFGLMVSAGMPELLSEDDISYMREQLCLGATDQEAAEIFLKELGASVSATSRRVDNFFHIAKHG